MENVTDLNEPFGKYILRRRLGVGGMAEVFLAEMVGPGGFARQAAVKRILPNLLQNEDFITAFVSEARLGGQLSHPNIVQTLELGQEGELLYLAMEYVDGLTLSSFLRVLRARRTPPPLSLALEIARQLCDGLAYAHSATDIRGVPLKMVHRDLKPANVLISFHAQLKITDFGVARAESNLQHTVAVGQIKGTVSYMSPEQAMAGAIDHRSDLFSLGAILFELFTLEHLYPKAGGIEGLLQAQRCELNHRFPLLDALPGSLKELIVALLQRDPAARPASAKVVRQALQPLLSLFPPELEELESAIREAHQALPGLQPPKLNVRQVVEASIRAQLPSGPSMSGSTPSASFPPAAIRTEPAGGPPRAGAASVGVARADTRAPVQAQFKDTIDLRLSEIFAQSEVLSLVQDAPAPQATPPVQLWSPPPPQSQTPPGPVTTGAPLPQGVAEPNQKTGGSVQGVQRVGHPPESPARPEQVAARAAPSVQEDEDDDFYRSFLRSLPGGQNPAEIKGEEPQSAPEAVPARPSSGRLEDSGGEAQTALPMAGVSTEVPSPPVSSTAVLPDEDFPDSASTLGLSVEPKQDTSVSFTGLELHDLLDDARPAEEEGRRVAPPGSSVRMSGAAEDALGVQERPGGQAGAAGESSGQDVYQAPMEAYGSAAKLLDLEQESPLEASVTGLQAASSLDSLLDDEEDDGATRQLPPGTHPLDPPVMRVERMLSTMPEAAAPSHPEWESQTDPGLSAIPSHAAAEGDDDLEVLAQLGGLHEQLDEAPSPARSSGWSRVETAPPPAEEPEMPAPDMLGDLLDASEKTMMLPQGMGALSKPPVSSVHGELRGAQEAGLRAAAQASLLAIPVQPVQGPAGMPSTPLGSAPLDPARASGTWSRQALQQASVLPPPTMGGVDGWTGRPGTGIHSVPAQMVSPVPQLGAWPGPGSAEVSHPGGALPAPVPAPAVAVRPPTVHPAGLSLPAHVEYRPSAGGPHTPPLGLPPSQQGAAAAWGTGAGAPMASVPPGFRAPPPGAGAQGAAAPFGQGPVGSTPWPGGGGAPLAGVRPSMPQGYGPMPAQEITHPTFGAGGRPVPTPAQEITNPTFGAGGRPVPTPAQEITNPTFGTMPRPAPPVRSSNAKLPLILGALAAVILIVTVLVVLLR